MDKTEKNVDKLTGAVSDMIASQAKHEERTKVLYDSIESTLRNDIVNMYNRRSLNNTIKRAQQ